MFKVFLISTLLIGCVAPQQQLPNIELPKVEITPLPKDAGVPHIALYWENTTEPHPERAGWSANVLANFKYDLELYSNASDIAELCPAFAKLDETDKLKALGEFAVALAYYESGFKPGEYSVDVGSKNDKESWSVGLYQMSGNDSSAKMIGANFEKLKDPFVNIDVFMIQLKKQISKRNKFFLDNSDSMRYWAVILKGNKYSKISEIKARILKHAPKCKGA